MPLTEPEVDQNVETLKKSKKPVPIFNTILRHFVVYVLYLKYQDEVIGQMKN